MDHRVDSALAHSHSDLMLVVFLEARFASFRNHQFFHFIHALQCRSERLFQYFHLGEVEPGHFLVYSTVLVNAGSRIVTIQPEACGSQYDAQEYCKVTV